MVPADELRSSLADAFGDERLTLAFPVAGNGHWTDSNGHPIDLRLDPGSGQEVTTVYDGGRAVAAIVHDAALGGQEELIAGAVAYTRVSVANDRLSARLESSLEEVSASRARISAAADDERRRIERDLHDGAQQRLVALRIQLELAEERWPPIPTTRAELLRRLGADVEATLEEMRDTRQRDLPAIARHSGLGEALRVAALSSPVPTRVSTRGSPAIRSARRGPCISAASRRCRTSPSTPARSASRSSSATMAMLHFVVTDDGNRIRTVVGRHGLRLPEHGDRLGAVDGELMIDSQPGRGTSVSGYVPVNGIPA